MTLPTWNLSTDPEYLRVRGFILKFFTAKSGRAYIDGRLSENQKDDVQDALLAYLERVLPSPDDGLRAVRLYLEVLHVITLRVRESRRRMIPIDTEGKVPEAKSSGVEIDPEDEVPEPHTLEDLNAERDVVRRAELGVLYDAMTNRLSNAEEIVLAMKLNGETSRAIGAFLGRSVNSIDRSMNRAVTKLRKITRDPKAEKVHS